MQSEYILGGININRNHIHGPLFRTNQPGQHLGDYRGIQMKKTIIPLCAGIFLFVTSMTALAGDVFQQLDSAIEKDTPVSPKAPFDEKAAREAMAPGDLTLQGVLSYIEPIYDPASRKAVDQHEGWWFGGPKPRHFVAKKLLVLFPETPYMTELLELLDRYRNERLVDGFAPVRKYARETTTDQYGRFSFPKLKPGKYFLVSNEHILERQERVMVPTTVNNVVIKDYYTHRYNVVVNYEGRIEMQPGQDELQLDARMKIVTTYTPR